MERVPVTSSNIESVLYNEEAKTLEVAFKGGGTYTYRNVEPEKYDGLIKANSIGSFFHKEIKSKHEFEKVQVE